MLVGTFRVYVHVRLLSKEASKCGQVGWWPTRMHTAATMGSPMPSPKTPVFSPLPYTPLSSAETQRLLKRLRTSGPTARQLFQDPLPSPSIPSQHKSSSGTRG